MLTGGTDPTGDGKLGHSMGSVYARLRGANHEASGLPTYCLRHVATKSMASTAPSAAASQPARIPASSAWPMPRSIPAAAASC